MDGKVLRHEVMEPAGDASNAPNATKEAATPYPQTLSAATPWPIKSTDISQQEADTTSTASRNNQSFYMCFTALN